MCTSANNDSECAGIITWMHTFSPSKMWLGFKVGAINIKRVVKYFPFFQNKKTTTSLNSKVLCFAVGGNVFRFILVHSLLIICMNGNKCTEFHYQILFLKNGLLEI